jgi:uncharacterized protein YqgC (DUF456 family)
MNLDPAIFLWLASVVLVVIGIAGLALPMLPGAPLLFAGLVLAAWAEDFQYVGTGGVIVLAVLALLTYLVDIVAGIFGARKFGASNQALVGAGIGTFVGIFFGPAGILLGPFLGAVAGELTVRRELLAAGKSGLGTTIGLVLGAAAKLALAFMMIGVYVFLRLI